MSYIQFDTSSQDVLEPYDKFEEYRMLQKITMNRSKKGKEATDEDLDSFAEELTNISQIINTNNGLLKNLMDEDEPLYTSLRYRSHQFHSLQRMYLNMAGLKLANIFSLLDDINVTKVLDIGGGPGGFATFIKSKYPDVDYYGITLESYPFDESLNLTAVYTESVFDENNYTTMDLKADLVLSDLADVDAEYQESDIHYINTSNDIAFSNLIKGGTYICKMFEVRDLITLRVAFNMGRSFKEWKLFKPITSPYENGEIYFIGLGYTGQTHDINLRKHEVNDLLEDLTQYNAIRSKAYASRISQDIVPIKYNIHLAKAMWGEK